MRNLSPQRAVASRALDVTKAKGLRVAAVFIAGSLAVAACGGSQTVSPAQTTAPTTVTPTTVTPTITTDVASTTAAPTTTEAPPSVDGVRSSYALAPGFIDVEGREHPIQVQGMIGVPEGEGPFPVAVVMHGSHPICIDDFIRDAFAPNAVTTLAPAFCATGFPEYSRSDLGLSYIVDDLVESGIAAVSIDVGAAFVWYNGEIAEQPAFEGILGAHFEILSRLNDGDGLELDLPAITNRLDLADVSLVGHSRGGEAAFRMLEQGRPLPFVPTAAVLIQPASPFELGPTIDVPVLLIRGGCDEDVGSDSGLDTLASLIEESSNNRSAVDMLIPQAGHRMLNRNFFGSTCPGEIEPAVAQHQVGQATASFLASRGGEVAVVTEALTEIVTLSGTDVAEVATALDENLPPLLPEAVSTKEVIEPLPPGASFSDAFDEDF